MIRIVISLLVFVFQLNGQSINYEEKASMFFFDSVFSSKYRNVRVVEFNSITEGEPSTFSFYNNCFEDQEGLKMLLHESSLGKTHERKPLVLEKLLNVKIKRITKRSEKRLKMFVYLANEVNKRIYVRIDLYKKDSYTDSFMFEFGRDGNLLRWCETGIIY